MIADEDARHVFLEILCAPHFPIQAEGTGDRRKERLSPSAKKSSYNSLQLGQFVHKIFRTCVRSNSRALLTRDSSHSEAEGP